jgi:hypothetical protein
LSQVGRQLDHTLVTELPGEGISRTGSETCWMTHLVVGLMSWGAVEEG